MPNTAVFCTCICCGIMQMRVGSFATPLGALQITTGLCCKSPRSPVESACYARCRRIQRPCRTIHHFPAPCAAPFGGPSFGPMLTQLCRERGNGADSVERTPGGPPLGTGAPSRLSLKGPSPRATAAGRRGRRPRTRGSAPPENSGAAEFRGDSEERQCMPAADCRGNSPWGCRCPAGTPPT